MEVSVFVIPMPLFLRRKCDEVTVWLAIYHTQLMPVTVVCMHGEGKKKTGERDDDRGVLLPRCKRVSTAAVCNSPKFGKRCSWQQNTTQSGCCFV